MLFTRFGDQIELVRLATIEDVKTFENRRVDKEDKRRTADGLRAIAKYTGITQPGRVGNPAPAGKEILVDAAFLKATDGSKEIHAVFEALKKAETPRCCCAGPDYHPDKPCPVHPKRMR